MILFPLYKSFCSVKNLNIKYCIYFLQKLIIREKHTPHGSYEYSMVGESSFLALKQHACYFYADTTAGIENLYTQY